MSVKRTAALWFCVVTGAACASEVPPATPTTPPKASASTAPPPATADAIGPKPALGAPKPFDPPAPVVFSLPSGVTVWLVERHTLPIVSSTLVVSAGSANDPPESPGLAHITADMLDEGAGSRNAIELSSAVNDLGAELVVGNSSDGSFASIAALKSNYAAAFALFADVVVRPRFDGKEWKRVSELWRNRLQKRADDPSSVSRVVTGAAFYGPNTPYGHPSDGLLRGAKSIDLAKVKRFYEEHWRPDVAHLVVAGDITKDEIIKLTTPAFEAWRSGRRKNPPAEVLKAAAPATARRIILVDRSDAPQSVIAVVRSGVAASDARLPSLELINIALGGSFTSRLNQNLREDHGWSYGARSAFTETRGPGAFVAKAAVHADKTGAALKEMMSELDKIASGGLSADELGKVRAQDRADLVQTYETVGGVTGRLGTLAMVGLPPDHDVLASRIRQGAALSVLAPLAREWLDPKDATIVIVGPRETVAPQLAQFGFGEPELWDPEGFPLGKGGASGPASGSKPSPAGGKKP